MESPPQASESLGLGAGEQSFRMSQGVRGCVVMMNQEHAKVGAGASCWAEVGDGEEVTEGGREGSEGLGPKEGCLAEPRASRCKDRLTQAYPRRAPPYVLTFRNWC